MADMFRTALNWAQKKTQPPKQCRKRQCRKRGRTRASDFQYQQLETRHPLAAFFLDPAGTLWVNGTEGPDVMVASIVSNQVRVSMNNHVIQHPRSAVNELVFLGRAGDDEITNDTAIPSRMYGGNGNDILRGGSGNDRLVGNRGDDIILGRGGDNILIGSRGNNTISGGSGNDRIFGGYWGHNVLRGEAGDNIIFAGNLGDEIHGGPGDDQIYGGAGPDLIYTGSGRNIVMANGGDDIIHVQGSNNWVHAGSGNDSIYTLGSNNVLRGGIGNDGILASGSNNRVLPGPGKNRVLVPPGQPAPQVSPNDALIRFENRTSNWTFKQIEAIDEGLKALHHRTNGTMVLKDTTSNEPLTIAKYRLGDPALAGAHGANVLQGDIRYSGTTITHEVYTREIRIEDFDVNDNHRYRWAGILIIHEISHNWDSFYEINQRLPGRGNIWNEFMAISSWRNTNGGSSFTRAALDSQEPFEYQWVNGNLAIPVKPWWYRTNAPFVRDYGRLNAKEDWAVTWEYIFMEPVYGSMLPAYSHVSSKVAKVNQLLDLMS